MWRMTTPGQWLARKLRLVKPNFQGVQIPAASGLTFLLLAPVSLALGAGVSVAVASALGVLGFLDDRFGDRSVGGFRGHLKALLSGKPTTGSLKLVGGGVAALAAAYGRDGPTFAILLDAPLIALAANALNLLDLRPGRACFGFLVLAAPSLIARPPGVALWPALGGFLLEWPFDARAKAMLGDTGSNFLGALAGALAMESLPLWGRASLLVLLLSLNLTAERVSLSRVISETPWLNWLDRRLGVRGETS